MNQDGFGGDLPLAQARALIDGRIAPLTDAENVPLSAAAGRVLAADVVSPIAVPGHDNAAMDGYALRGADLAPGGDTCLRIAGTALAGRPYDASCAPGACVRITTGAVMPAGCDTVVPQELVRVEGDAVTVPAGAVRPGQHRRLCGEDVRAGAVALARGRVLRASDVGLLAALGVAEVRAVRRLRVAVLSTGDELRAPGAPLAPGCIHDSNRYTLLALLARLGADPVDLGIVRDDPALLAEALRAAAAGADAILTSGGAAAGAADHMRAVLAELGDVDHWTLAMRPGRPLTFGRIGRAWLFGLPGNPVAAMTAFLFVARAALLRLAGADCVPPAALRARVLEPIRKRPGRAEFLRGVLGRGADGLPTVRLTGAQGSGMLSSMAAADCIVALAHAQGDVAAGELVDVVPLEGLL